MDNHAADVPRITQADVFPVLAGVGGFVHPVAERDVAADAGFASAHVDHVGIGSGDGDASDGGDPFLVEDRLPGRARVGGLPDAARNSAEVIHGGIARHAGDRE